MTPAQRLAQRTRLGLLIAASALSLQASAGTTVNKFEPTAQLGGSTLQLNGKGTRVRLVFKAYDMGLYTTKRVSTPAELLALPGPKRLHFIALRELPGTEFGRLFLRGMGDNTPSAQMTRHALATTRLIEIFSGKPKLMPGDTFAMDFVPGKPFSSDNFRSLQLDSVPEEDGLAALGIVPTPAAAVMPGLLAPR